MAPSKLRREVLPQCTIASADASGLNSFKQITGGGNDPQEALPPWRGICGEDQLVRRYVDRQFSDAYLSTVGVKISRKVVALPDAVAGGPAEIQLVLWDIEGLTNPRIATPSYLTGAHGAVVVGDVSRPATTDAVRNHIDLFLKINPKGLVVVALNKFDLLPDPGNALELLGSGAWDTDGAAYFSEDGKRS